MIRNLRCTVTIHSVLANSKTLNAFLLTVNAIFLHDYLLAVEPGSTPRPLVQEKKLGEILYLLICSFLPCLSWLLRSRVRKSRRDLWITLYSSKQYKLGCSMEVTARFKFRSVTLHNSRWFPLNSGWVGVKVSLDETSFPARDNEPLHPKWTAVKTPRWPGNVSECHVNTLRTGLLNCLNARSRSLTIRHRASCIQGQAFRYSPENAFYIFNQQIYFIIWYLLDGASLI